MSDIQQFILSKLEKLDEKLDEVREHNAHMRASFDSHVIIDQEIHEDVVKLGLSIDKHSNLLDQYNQQLEIHMKRTDLLEKSVLPLIRQRREEETVKKWRDGRWSKIAKIAGWLSAIGGFIVIVLKIVSELQ
jgi:hypothetical protein